jgi:YVTN family beta-propeller protein
VVATIPTQYEQGAGVAYGVAYDLAKAEIFVTHSGVNTVTVISDSTNTIIANISVGLTPEELAYDSRTGQLFVANTVDGTVSVISDSTNQVVSTVTVGNGPFGVAYDPSKSEVFVTNAADSTVSVISDSSSTSTPTATASSTPTTTPEFGSAALVSVAAAMAIVTLSAVVISRKKVEMTQKAK